MRGLEQRILWGILLGLAMGVRTLFGQVVPGREFDATLCPFQQTIGSGAVVDPAGDAGITANTGAECLLAVTKWTYPIYYVDGCDPAAYTLEDIWLTKNWNPGGKIYPHVPVPTGKDLLPDPTRDGHIGIVDLCHGIEYDFFACQRTRADRWKRTLHQGKKMLTCMSADKFYLKGSGASPIALSAKGSGFALVPGLIRPQELQAGVIPHALALAISFPASGGPMPPATLSDEEAPDAYPAALPDGTHLRLKPSVWTDAVIAAQPWPDFEKAIARALRDYGAFITDSAGNRPQAQFYAENPTWYTSDPYAGIPGLAVEKWGGMVIFDSTFFSTANFEVVDPHPQLPYDTAINLGDDDGDGIPSATEVAWGDLDAYQADPANAVVDADRDGLDARWEWGNFATNFYPSNPVAADSDGDGVDDPGEIVDGTDPADPFSVNLAPALGTGAFPVPSGGRAPLAVQWRAVVRGGTGPFTYAWDFGDGSGGPGTAQVTHTYTQEGIFTVRLDVQDGTESTASSLSFVEVGSGPWTAPPGITKVKQKKRPFRLVLRGGPFQKGCRIFIDGVEVPTTRFDRPDRIEARGGSTLKAMLPVGQAVKVLVVNSDGTVSRPAVFTR